jgi:protein MpaA
VGRTTLSRLLSAAALLSLAVTAPAAAAPAASGSAAATQPAKRLNIGATVVFGSSVNGVDLVAYRVGTPGGRVVLIVGNVHGDELKGIEITQRLRMSDIPDGIDLWVVDTINPDGVAVPQRQNANGVDLNRNFSYGWGYIPRSATNRQYSGEAPADQPETQALQGLVDAIHPAITVFYHQDANRVSLAGARKEIPAEYARLVGQSTGSTPCTAGCTGTAGSYVNHAVPGGTSFLVELPNSSVVTSAMIDRHVAALLTVMVL